MSMPSIGIIGAGFVGGALARGFAQYTDVKVYDKDEGKSTHNLVDTVWQDILFVAVPTPMKADGSCDTKILEQVLTDVSNLSPHRLLTGKVENKITVVRSTIPPAFLRENKDRWDNLDLVYTPEFLTERTADLDFIQSNRFIFGTEHGVHPDYRLAHLFEARFPRVRQVFMTWEEAALVKYGTNVFFTVKLSFFNELALVAGRHGANATAVINEILQDGRIGRSHYQIPGHDGDRGWGGICFPKDNRAYAKFAAEADVQPTMAEAAWETNQAVRTKRDWEDMKGRAVSED